ncbi:MAG: orotidine-5'-phosphate decarboxylase [Burkholderiales bacterium]|nr:orotidine-5'-phosphate decarboxylase [Burkholderiales bacterium]
MVSSSASGPRVVVALDFPSAGEALALVDRLAPGRCRLKVGKELFTRAGPRLVRDLAARGFDVFLDLKYHDIPNTVSQACAAATDLGVWMLNVHALGGRRMMERARAAVEGSGRRPLLIAVTVLTSHCAADLAEIGLPDDPQALAVRLASLAQNAGMDGVVCSAQEAAVMRQRLGAGFLLVTPGIRSAADAADDQRRVATPGMAIGQGASYLVVGRPITRAVDPLAALEAINQEIVAAEAATSRERS